MASEELCSLATEARKHLSTTFRNITAFLSGNRYTILQSIIILLRLGQVAAVAIVALIFSFMIFEINTHDCQYYPQHFQCLHRSDLTTIPFSYVLVLVATLASGVQLCLLALLKSLSATARLQRNCKATKLRSHAHSYGFLLSPTDVFIFVLYVFAFVAVSDYMVPTHILRGARSGTGCWLDNQYNEYLPVVLQQCVLAQHGYWWCLGAMLSYLFVSILYGIVRIEASIAERVECSIGTVTSMLDQDDRSAPRNALESVPLLLNEDDEE